MNGTDATSNPGSEAGATGTGETPGSMLTAEPPATGQADGQQQQGQQTGNESAGESKPDAAAQTAGAPEKYEFTAPDGQTYDAAVLDTFSAAAKDANLPQDAAQKMLQTMGPALAARQAEQIKAVQDGWAADARKDTEFGGDKLNENLAVAREALEQFAPNNADGTQSEFRKVLETTGLGNHPEVIRFLYRAGKALGTDGFISGRAGGAAAPTDWGNVLYPNTPKK